MPPDEQLQLLAARLGRALGEGFFPALAEHLGITLGAREALICESAPPRGARSLAVWRDGAIAANLEYDLAGTPCARVYGGERLLLTIDPAKYPTASPDRACYFGLPLAAKDGAVLGHLCAWFDHVVNLDDTQRAVCDLLANRAAAELRLVHVKRERSLLRAQRHRLRAEIAAHYDVQDLVGASSAHQQMLAEIQRITAGEGAVLVSGEPGTGKELVARAIHAAGARAARPFTRIDCTQLLIGEEIAALPQTFALTAGGTLFFDEIGALSLPMQERLQGTLRTILDERRASGAGETRIMAATHRPLHRMVRDGAFQAGLVREFGAFVIELPPLRTRVEDIPVLVNRFIQKQARRLARNIEGVDPESLAALLRYSWPGNVRELAAVVERALISQPGPILKIATDAVAGSPAERAALIAAASVDTASTGRHVMPGPAEFDDTLNTGLHAVQREHILRVLNATRWVIEGNSGAALRLGLKPATLRHRMKKLGISRAQNPQVT